ncbi:MAG: cation diffusion facilitator family transporter [Candidatus Edwardsbacteria bacterium]|nr:cation diffusion facilitator family transporter [Candidatus Edwardsbacteria bacterium]MBU1575900.1 cation diffusion facilitator family transporter [Candidatus Edwardsbacteria bacterium]MBU2464328.1 cation diffusion facilitator family transporter [Candidatus Edwardsbacteria bacterium]MBU2593113.1 cation diffusion facilitator family transporter [Candidatus Edwardsbacteria bacterium]
MSHNHDHHHHRQAGQKGLFITLILTGLVMLAEFLGGWLSGSLALLSDAGHMLTDVLAIALSLLAMRFALQPATEKKTYGFFRLEILAALINGITLILLSGYIFYEAWQRFSSPIEIKSGLMIIVAVIGLLANLAGFFILKSSSKHSLNVRGAFLHIIGDLLSSVAVVIGGLLIRFTGFYLIDPILSIIIGLVILKGAYGLVKESVDILLEAAPAGIESREIEKVLAGIKGVKALHHLHVWSLSSGIHALSAHVQIDDQMTSQSDALLKEIQELLEHKFGILHTTIQFECTECNGVNCHITETQNRCGQ